LDRSNINNAYVSGMKEELNMFGTELNVRLSLNLMQHVVVTDQFPIENNHNIYMRLYCRNDSQYAPVVACFGYPLSFNPEDNVMLQIVSPRIWLPLMQIIWGVLTFWYAVV